MLEEENVSAERIRRIYPLLSAESERCPVCGSARPAVKAGVSRSGDALCRCPDCLRLYKSRGRNRRIWRSVLIDMLDGKTIFASARRLGIDSSAVIRMREKLRNTLELK